MDVLVRLRRDDEPVPVQPVVTISDLYAAHRLRLVRLAVLLVDDLETAEDVVASGKVPFPPEVVGMPELGEAGAEIVVDGRARADGALVQVFTLTEDRLVRLEVPGSDDGAFYLEGGGVTAPAGAGCRADGTLVLSTAEAQARDYRVTRRFYRLVDDTLVTASPQTTRTVPGDALVQRFPEFGSSHFAACGGQVRSAGM